MCDVKKGDKNDDKNDTDDGQAFSKRKRESSPRESVFSTFRV